MKKPKFPIWCLIVSDILLIIPIIQVIVQFYDAKASNKALDVPALVCICAVFGIPALIFLTVGFTKYKNEMKQYNYLLKNPPPKPSSFMVSKELKEKILTAAEDGMIAKRYASEGKTHPFDAKEDFTQEQIKNLKTFLHKTPLTPDVACPFCGQKMERKYKWQAEGWSASGFSQFLPIYKVRCQSCGIIVQGAGETPTFVFPMGFKGKRRFNLLYYTRNQLIALREALEVQPKDSTSIEWETFLEWDEEE